MECDHNSIRNALLDLEDRIDEFLLLDNKVYFRSILATYMANRYEGDPVWIFLIGPPSNGKTELVRLLSGVKDCHFVDSMTPASLLPGSTTSSESAGGLLNRIGKRGTLVIPDFTVTMEMGNSQLNQILSFFRNIYDGSFCRVFGNSGGKRSEWKGKIGMIGCVTPAYDRCHAVNSTMGDRSLLVRMTGGSEQGYDQAMMVLGRSEAGETRQGLVAGTGSFLKSLGLNQEKRRLQLTREVNERIAAVSTLAAACRGVARRDKYGEVAGVPEIEGPTRMSLQLRAFYQGCIDIGLLVDEAEETVTYAAMSSIPPLRRLVFDTVLSNPEIKCDRVAEIVKMKSASTRRVLQELINLGVLTSQPAKGVELYSVSERHQDYSAAAGILQEVSNVPGMVTQVHFPAARHLQYHLPLVSKDNGRNASNLPEQPLPGEQHECTVNQSATMLDGDFPEKSHAHMPPEEATSSPTPPKERKAAKPQRTYSYPEPGHTNTRPLKAGDVFNGWTALEDDPGRLKTKVLCRCDCGSEKMIRMDTLYSGMSKTCGCSKKRETVETQRLKNPAEMQEETDGNTDEESDRHSTLDKAYDACGA